MKAIDHKSYHQKPDNYYTQGRPEMVSLVPNNARKVLDIGCSTGEFGKLLKSTLPEVEVWGVEMHAKTAKKAQKVLDHVLVTSIEEAIQQLPKHSFDVIVFNDVLEHLIDPEHVLMAVKPLLAPEGVVISSIPNLRYFYNLTHILFDKNFQYEDDGIRDKTHVRFFTEKSIQALYADAGYTLVSHHGINPIPGWKFSLAKRLSFGFLDDTQFLQFATVAQIDQ